MWPHPEPVGQGRPDADDDKAVREFAQQIYKRLSDNCLEDGLTQNSDLHLFVP
jgi:hypothetical protein